MNGLDLLGRSRTFQIHWLKRFAAYFVDLVVVFIYLWIPLYVLGVRDPVVYGLWGGGAVYAYSTVAEALFRSTIGKYLLGLEVRSLRGSMTLPKAAVRNFPKLFWFVFPFLDTLAGLVVEGDPRQRWSDKILGTTVAQSSLIHVRLHEVEAVRSESRSRQPTIK